MRTLVLVLENILFPFGALGFFVHFAFSRRRGLLKELPEELKQRLGILTADQKRVIAGRSVLWIHAASAGEVAAASPLIRRVRREKSDAAIIVTSSTAAGRRRAQELSGVDLALLAPLDFFWSVGNFLRGARPSALLITETELWPQMIEWTHRSGAPISLVNGRLSDRSFKFYCAFRFLFAPFLSRIGLFCVQTDRDARKFKELGAAASRVTVTGNMKYDAPAADHAAISPAIQEFGWGSSPLWVCASTHPGEEEIICSAYGRLKQNFPNLKLVIAPRHPERAGETARTLASKSISFCRWSAPKSSTDCLLIDAFGVLAGFYALSTVSFVGGTLMPVGGHNLLEPALAAKPVLFGPYTSHTAEAAEILERSGGGLRVKDERDLISVMTRLLSVQSAAAAAGAKAFEAAMSLRGATERTLTALNADSDFKKILQAMI